MFNIISQLKKIDRIVFAYPRITAAIILAITVFFAFQLPAVRMASEFSDLLPQQHPYIQTHNKISETFGGANNVVVAIKVKTGTIFTNDTLNRIYRITQSIDSMTGINHNLVSSLTHRNTRKIWLNEFGTMKSAPHYDPLKKGGYSDEELKVMQNEVVANPRVYGLLVSPDLTAALVRGTLNEGELDYSTIFSELEKIRLKEATDDVEIYATGKPVLIGWVTSYVGEILQIFLYTVLVLLVLLVLYFRRFYGVLLPLIGIVLTTVWGLGILALLGYNLDPLMMVVPFLISARAMSHGIQLVERFYHEHRIDHNKQTAARNTFEGLFRPGSLGVISDAIGLLLISLGSVPINDKLAVYSSLWAGSVIITVLIFVPVLLEILPETRQIQQRHTFLHIIFEKISRVACTRKGARFTLISVVLLYVVGGYFSSWVQVGQSEPGSPLLYPTHDYNVSSKAINGLFPGSEELYIIAHTDEKAGLKEPKVIRALADFQNYMMLDPEMGGSKGLPDLVTQVNRIIHNTDPRWLAYPKDKFEAGGLMFTYMMSSPIPGALKEFLDPDEQNANMVFYYKDHKGETIRRAIHMVKEWANSSMAQIDGFSLELAGGVIGVTAAINEAAYNTNIVVIPLVFLLILVFVTVFYWSFHAGWLMLLAMSFATTLTYAYMGITGIGINVNTVPIIAVGIGVGIDYSIYIMDRIREEYLKSASLQDAIREAIGTTGVAIGFTALALIAGVVMWVFISTMRFQADAALLLIVMLVLNALAAMFLVPAWIMTFKPKFIISVRAG
ncbi:MAG TPA: transporter [Aeromonadales bacterium]|nr:transporter [Aeromonadales bacterium]